MPRPVIICGAHDPIALGQIEGELTKRHDADYDLRFATGGASAIALVQSFAAEERDLALVIADEAISDPTGIDVLARARDVSPSTRRALLVRAGERPVQPRCCVPRRSASSTTGW